MSTPTTPDNALSYTRGHRVFAFVGMRRKNMDTDKKVAESDEMRDSACTGSMPERKLMIYERLKAARFSFASCSSSIRHSFSL